MSFSLFINLPNYATMDEKERERKKEREIWKEIENNAFQYKLQDGCKLQLVCDEFNSLNVINFLGNVNLASVQLNIVSVIRRQSNTSRWDHKETRTNCP